MRQGDGSDLLGAQDARSASIGIIYVAPTDDRSSILEAILTQDKLGRKQVAVVLPENSRAFQRPVDFDGLKNMRRGLKTEIIFIAPAGPGPAEFARQRRFAVYTSLESYATALRSESPDTGNAKKGRALFTRRPKLVPEASAPAPIADLNGSSSPPSEPVPVPVMPVPANSTTTDEDNAIKRDDTAHADPLLILGGAAIAGTSMAAGDNWLPATTSPHTAETGSHADPVTEDEITKPSISRPKSEPTAIPLSLPTPQARITAKLPAANGNVVGASTAPLVKNRNTGKRAAVGVVAAGAASAAAFAATGSAPSAGGAPPPVRGNTGGTGGGGGGGGRSRRSTRQLLAILLVILTLLLLAGIAFASPMGQGLIGHITGSTVTATVTITPDFQNKSDKIIVTAVTGKPDPTAQQVQATILSYTSPSGSGSANATGSIAGANASGSLTFLNTGFSGITISGGILTGKSGVPVTFNGPLFVPVGSVTVGGTAVNQGVAGDIPRFDIAGTCCGSNSILVRNTTAFSGGVDPLPNSVITQKDINTATNNLISSLTPAAQTALQQKVQPGQQVVNNTLKCSANNPTSDQPVGAHVKHVTVTGTVTCTEEVYDQKAALATATTALKAEAAKDPGPAYALVGNVVTNITSATVIDKKGTVSLVIAANGVWVYQFSDAMLTALKNKIAKEPEGTALADVQKTAGVKSAEIKISSGTTMPDAANITITIVKIPGATGSPTPTPGNGSPVTTPGTTPTGAPVITPTPGLGGGPPTTPTVLGGS